MEWANVQLGMGHPGEPESGNGFTDPCVSHGSLLPYRLLTRYIFMTHRRLAPEKTWGFSSQSNECPCQLLECYIMDIVLFGSKQVVQSFQLFSVPIFGTLFCVKLLISLQPAILSFTTDFSDLVFCGNDEII